MTPALARIVGFVVVVHGLGLRLDSSWQGTAMGLILGGAGLLVWAFAGPAFVSERGGR